MFYPYYEVHLHNCSPQLFNSYLPLLAVPTGKDEQNDVPVLQIWARYSWLPLSDNSRTY